MANSNVIASLRPDALLAFGAEGSLTMLGRRALVLPADWLDSVARECSLLGIAVEPGLIAAGRALGRALRAGLPRLVTTSLGVASLGEVPLPDFLDYVNTMYKTQGFGSVTLRQAEGAVMVFVEAPAFAPKTAASTHFAGLIDGFFAPLAGGSVHVFETDPDGTGVIRYRITPA